MIWGAPAALWALLALAAPLVIHLLVRRRAKPTPFPTLRFIPRTRLVSVDRRSIDDAVLLAVRTGALAAAVAAIAGPFVMTAARQRAWNAVTVRADVDRLPGGIGEALAWLETQGPGRRELIVRSTFPVGSIADDAVSRIPKHVGLRFEREGSLPATRTFLVTPVIYGQADGSTVRTGREARLDGSRTNVRNLGTPVPSQVPIELVAPDSRRSAADDVLKSVIASGVPVAIGNRTARIELVDGAGSNLAPVVDDIRIPWMANAVARIWQDLIERSSLPNGAAFSGTGAQLTVRVDAAIPDSVLAHLVRSVLNAIAPAVDHPQEEILPIPDAQLRVWSREPGPALNPSIEQRPNDGRWFWMLSLVLLAAEAWIRSSSRRRADAESELVERTRVA